MNGWVDLQNIMSGKQMDIRRVKFNKARVKQLIRDHADGKKLPTWATNVTENSI